MPNSAVDVKSIVVRDYRDLDWPRLRLFIQHNWGCRHPMAQKTLFDWQAKGFGHTEIRSLVAECGNRIVGFRGFIPGVFQVPRFHTGMTLRLGASSFMWSIDKEYRSYDLAIRMQKKVTDKVGVITGAGTTESTSRILYKYFRFSRHQTNRFILPLSVHGYASLLRSAVDMEELSRWESALSPKKLSLDPCEPDLREMAYYWRKATFSNRIFGLYRTAEFFDWRYRSSEGFDYLFFGGPDWGGTIIGRIENVLPENSQDKISGRVFRIIELIPYSEGAWQQVPDQRFVGLIESTLEWARERGMWAADFHCSSLIFGPMLRRIGFRNFADSYGSPLTDLCVLFRPPRWDKQVADIFYSIKNMDGSLMDLALDKVYMVKSDGDQDRPY